MDRLAEILGTQRKQIIRWESDENFPTEYQAQLEEELEIDLESVKRLPPEAPVARRLRRVEAQLKAQEEVAETIEQRLLDLERRVSGADENPG